MQERKTTPYGGHGVQIGLQHANNTAQVFWSQQYNSFVITPDPKGQWLTPDDEQVSLLSINGIGEIRWPVMHYGSGMKYFREGSEELAAIDYFHLKPLENA